MTCTRTEFFTLFFNELERRGIPCVILHSYENFPENVTSDIDCAVEDADLPRIRPILAELADRCGWMLAQTLQHQVFAFYSVVIDPSNPTHYLKIDVCSHYVKDRCFLLRDVALIEGRQRYRGFCVPAPAAEFIYVLAKVFGKNKNVAEFLPRLRELWERDKNGAQQRFDELFGNTRRTLEDWFAQSAEVWARLNANMRARNRYGPRLLARELRRVTARAMCPTGLYLALLGPDGAGKSTLLENLRGLLEPCFRRQRIFHFRPMLFEKQHRGIVTDPHAQPPRSPFENCLKLFYYAVDWWLGFLLLVLPARARSTLVVFDRNFEDILIDPKRYRLRGAGTLARALRRLLPCADLTFVLDAEPRTIHARKPELPLEETERQLRALRALAASSSRHRLISADNAPADVAREVSAQVIHFLAAREARRSGV